MAAVIISPGMKPPRPPGKGAGPSSKMQPPAPPTDTQVSAAGDGGKVSHEDCVFIPADKHCGSCSNYSPQDGSCIKVTGTMDTEDCCVRFFVASGEQGPDEQEPDADDMGGEASSLPPGANG